MAKLESIDVKLKEAPDKQISLVDPDARAMVTHGRGTGVVGYYVQTAVDTQHHLIAAHEVTNVGHDSNQMANRAKQAKTAIGVDELNVVADRGYSSGGENRQCHEAGITAFVPKCLVSVSKAAGWFDKADFIHHPGTDEYACPADLAIRQD